MNFIITSYFYCHHCCCQSPFHSIFVVQSMAISGTTETEIIAKEVIPSKLHTALNAFIMCMVWHVYSFIPIC